MKGMARFGLGAAAALTVFACDLYIVRMEHIVFLLPTYGYLAYVAAGVASIPFMLAGGLVAALQGSTTRPVVVFGSGMLLPALFLAWSNGSALEHARREVFQTADPRAATTAITTPWELPAFAGGIKIFPAPKSESARTSFIRAITGVERRRTWYVVAGAARAVRQATDMARAVNETEKEFPADVYHPYGENPFFKVVIGAELPFNQAVELRDKAIKAGIPIEPRLIYHRK